MPLVGPPTVGVLWEDLDGRVVIFNPATQQAAALNETASAIWRLATGDHNEEQVIAVLAEDYNVEATVIRDQVLAAIIELRGQGLLGTVSDSDSAG